MVIQTSDQNGICMYFNVNNLALYEWNSDVAYVYTTIITPTCHQHEFAALDKYWNLQEYFIIYIYIR